MRIALFRPMGLPPYAPLHFKLKVAGFVTTSIEMVVQKSLER
jgi:hypothetical protein